MLVCCAAGFTDTISIQNPGFEEPGDGTLGYVTTPAGWSCGDQCYEYPYACSESPFSPLGDLGSPDGSSYGALAANDNGVHGVSGFTQVVAGVNIAPTTQYTLQVLVGGRGNASNWGFGGSLIELYDETSSLVLASQEIDRGAPGYPSGGWVTSTASFTTGGSGGSIGDQLAVVLDGLGQPGSPDPQTWFDDVSLVSAPVPEPTTLTLLGSALLGLGVVYLRRGRNT